MLTQRVGRIIAIEILTGVPSVIQRVYSRLSLCFHLVAGVHIPNKMVADVVTDVDFLKVAIFC